jgi:DNA repair exonuclease SbcCD ATPase subunit
VKLIKLTIKDFKGIKNFILNTSGGNLNVFGDNATGKTSLTDALQWLLFGKDSQGKADFKIKPFDRAGNEIHHLTTEVEGSFNLDGNPVTLKKAYYEKWTKKRGSTTSDFTGHTTDYYIDGVPKPKKEYDAFIINIVDENVFKLLTNSAYFNEQLKWQDRRKILLDVCGDISDSDVIASSKELSKLPEILGNRSLEDHKKVIAARQTAINKDLREIPARIDEKKRGLPDIADISSREVLEIELASLKKQLAAKQNELNRVENGGEIAEKQRAIREIESKLLDIQTKHRAATQDKSFVKKRELQELQLKINQIDSRIATSNKSIESNLNFIETLTKRNDGYRVDWQNIDDQTLEFFQETVCPTCGQDLPEDQLSAALEKAQADFNLKKAEQLKTITASGQANNAKISELAAENEALQKEIKNHINGKSIIVEEAEKLQVDIDRIDSSNTPSIEENAEYKQAIQSKTSLEQQIAALNNQKQTVVSQIKSEASIINLDIAARERNIAQLDQSEKDQKRIIELENQEKSLGAEYEKLQSEMYLVEEFTRTKVNLLESRINDKFKMARFKMFDVQINGGLNETCVTTLNGAPYDGALNSGHKIIVGLDIIATLSKHYGLSAPIFIDNAESVTALPPMDAQIIRLVVSKPDKALRVEYETSTQPNNDALGQKLF